MVWVRRIVNALLALVLFGIAASEVRADGLTASGVLAAVGGVILAISAATARCAVG